MNVRTSRLLVATLVLCGGSPGTGQTRAAAVQKLPEGAGQPSVFASGAEVVRLDMVVRHKDGSAVTDLRPDEVQVFEDGKACPVSTFRYVQAETAAAAPQARSSTTPQPKPLAQPEPTGGAAETPGSVIALVFDQLSGDPASRARAAALEMLKRPFPKQSLFAVFKTGEGLRVLQPFTRDVAVLPVAIEKATTGAERSQDPAGGRIYDNATEEALALMLQANGGAARVSGAGVAPSGPVPTGGIDLAMLQVKARMARFSDLITRENRGYGSVTGLLAIARGLATVDGRKTLLYFSEGLDVPPAVDDAYRTMVSAANRSNLSIYSFDTRGLLAKSPLVDARLATELAAVQGGSPTSGRIEDDPTMTALDAVRLNRQGVLRDLSESTGGFLVAETNDLRPGLDRVAADLRSYYEVAYAPPNPKPDGRWRAIGVKVTRPGVTVRTRKGYFAFPPGAPILRPAELPLITALETKPLPHEIELRGAVLRVVDQQPAPEALVLVEVPLTAATIEKDEAASLWRARLQVLGLVKDEKGDLVARLSHDAPLEGPLAEAGTAQQGTLVVRRPLRLKPGRYVLETAVQDAASGRLGARRTAFDVPSVSAGLGLGSVVVARATEVDDAAGTAEGLLRAGKLQAAPLLGRPIAFGTQILSLFLSARAVPGEPPPTVELDFRLDGQTVARSTPSLPAADANGRIAYIGSFPIAGFAPGRYEVLVRARQGESEAIEGTSFTIARPPETAGSTLPRLSEQPATTATKAHAVAAPPDVLLLLAKAGEAVVEFQAAFRNVVAEETYRQWAGSKVRTLRSDLVFATVPAEIPWVAYRDVFEVDGQKVRDRDARLEALLAGKGASSFERANAILRESARFNLGPLYRTANVPTLALALLQPENQWRFRWEKRGRRTFHGHEGIELHAEETATPTLVRERAGGDLPVEGRLWVEASSGLVLRTETAFRTRVNAQSGEMLSSISTQYRPEPSLALWVPEEMVERYENVPFAMRDDMERFDGTINARARYSNHRRFSVQVETESARLPADEHP